jgi:hypothetical protein
MAERIAYLGKVSMILSPKEQEIWGYRHEGMSWEQISKLTGKTPASCRALKSKIKTKLAGALRAGMRYNPAMESHKRAMKREIEKV